MKLGAFWAKAIVSETDRDGKRCELSCWRSSESSQADAHENAVLAAKRALRRLLAGDPPDRYAYGETPLREETIDRISDSFGRIVGVVTRNRYGALVLNTERAMFFDLDFPPVALRESVSFFFRRLIKPSARSPDSHRELETVRRLHEVLSDMPDWSLRLYRTHSGLRALVMHDVFDPLSDDTKALMESFGCDPLYVRLCKSQGCFRARLTPKPWRCGHPACPVRWPTEDANEDDRFRQWLAGYRARCSRYATCRFLGVSGSAIAHPEVAAIVELHDRATQCDEQLPLA